MRLSNKGACFLCARQKTAVNGSPALFLQAQRPFDAAEQVLLIGFAGSHIVDAILEVRVGVPQVFAMADGGVENAPLAVGIAP